MTSETPGHVVEAAMRNDHLHVLVRGRADGLGGWQDIFDRVGRAADEYDARRVLVDLRPVAGTVTTLEDYELAAGMPGAGLRFRRVAIVEAARYLREGRFLENAARNRGIDLRVFEDEPPALAWLRERDVPAGDSS